ncbi:RNA-binding domain-containing protein [Eremomyces bilateralis CBS 781.70]|uniref:RNA-binding domain-containing protein n=1 Tax=Eremomyces bilateralis CBS 781.70 TaxID=1392243 RepID=A0A6G1G3N3_9PEZI|nr:RNA-binding domain-containing protein [Eremomyces bilateralis CBS 781.70]KAF1812541.1 RNA-binding domain-containing protein [Eremomyces bilateralis CBS 781.70]
MSAAVEAVTAQLATASIEKANGDHIDASKDEAVIASAAEGRRLYIGNLAYATTEEELKEFFKDYLVESTSIPTNPRTQRPVGYAFVDLSTPSEAERAIAELNGQSILDRKVSIQLARKPEPAGEGAIGEDGTRRSSQRGRGRARGRGGRAARGGRTVSLTHSLHQIVRNEAGEVITTEGGPQNVPGQVLPLTDVTNTALTESKGTEGEAIDAENAGKPRVPRERKQRGPPEDGVPSKTKVMVANLPYDLREDKLMEIFAEYSPSSAKIALRPIPRFMVKKLQARGEPRKGRGFGFVTLATEEMQQKACDEMNGKEIEGREIAVKVAIDSPGKEDDDLNGEQVAAGENVEPEATATADAPTEAPATATA